jgi:hypothetical protein
MKIAASTPVVDKLTTDSAQFTKGKGGKKGSPKGQRQWGDEQWTQWQPTTWLPPPIEPSWQSFSTKGKGQQQTKPKQWCDIHQAYGHSTDWCFDNPHRTGGPPKWASKGSPKQEWQQQEWCDHHQTYGHSTAACRKGKGLNQPSPQPGQPPPPKGGKGKVKGPRERKWKSDNFPADYDQATPAIQAIKTQEWWEVEVDEISSVCLHSPPPDVNLAIFDDDELDEVTTNLIELHFAALIEQHTRKQQYKSSPSASLQADIIRHEQYIQFASSLLDPMYQPVIDRFQLLLINATDANGSTATSAENINSVLLDAEIPSELNFSPRDRDIDAKLPLGEELVSDIAGQASAA